MSPEEYRAASARLARLEATIEASRRGESRLVTWEEFQPLFSGWRAEIKELIRMRAEAGIPEGVHWEPPGGFRDWSAEMKALPWRTAKERGWDCGESDGE